MQDTDWRPTLCPVCGETRAADKDPICRNKECRVFGYLPVEVTNYLNDAEKAPSVNRSTTSRFQKVECYQTADGELHAFKEDAVAHELAKLLRGTDEIGKDEAQYVSHAITQSPNLRTRIVELLKELG